MWEQIGLITLIVSGTGLVFKCVMFERNKLPGPGFGSFEIMILPWLLSVCIGVGLFLNSIKWPVIIMTAGYFFLGFLVRLLSSLFGGKIK